MLESKGDLSIETVTNAMIDIEDNKEFEKHIDQMDKLMIDLLVQIDLGALNKQGLRFNASAFTVISFREEYDKIIAELRKIREDGE